MLYVSSASSLFSDDQLVTFLRSWRDYNGKHNITGFLLYHEGNFIQVIEGPTPAIQNLVPAIQIDTRHHGMLILWNRSINQREFGEWCMGFRNSSELAPEDQRAFSTLLFDSRQDERFRLHGGVAHRMLLQFKNVCARQYQA